MTQHQFDLAFERVVDLSPEQIWQAWTTPAYLKQWFTPAPWKTIDCELDLRPGGLFRTVMQSPEGQEFPNEGCYLEVLPNQKLVWTNALEQGYRPAQTHSSDKELFFFTACICLEAEGTGTRYKAKVMHSNEADCKKHENMGFHTGWNQALDQLIATMKSLQDQR